jgi:hypothetical protein
MNWRLEIDYHGSRANEPASKRPDRGLVRIANLARRLLGKVGRQPEPPMVLLHDGKHSFSLLGLDSGSAPSGKAADCPFPLKREPIDRRSYRVFP